MQTYGLTKNEIKELSEIVLSSFLNNKNTNEMACIDIDGLAEYFELTIKYETIAEKDRSKLAFFSDGKTPLKVYRNKEPKAVRFPANTIILDNYLRRLDMSSKRRYTLAHEIGHYLLERFGYAKAGAAFFNEFNSDNKYSIDELKELMNYNEVRANEIAACLLMPDFLLIRYLNMYFNGTKIKIYGEHLMKADTKEKIKAISDSMGVSFSALMIQLKKIGYLQYLPGSVFLREVP